MCCLHAPAHQWHCRCGNYSIYQLHYSIISCDLVDPGLPALAAYVLHMSSSPVDIIMLWSINPRTHHRHHHWPTSNAIQQQPLPDHQQQQRRQ